MTESTLPNTEIGRFRLEERVGHGGMGIVYRGFDPVLNRPAAIKLLAPHLGSDDDAFARFHREAALVASLKHTNIATVYEFGEFDNRPYIAMEWIAGRTLKALLREEGILSEERSLHLFDQLASALDYAHSYGVVHRDLKPANIIVGGDDLVTIVDFGLAWLDDAKSLTQTGSIVGTPLYMSPEQIQGKPLDGRSDQYSLGIILYEMLSGSPPFENPTTPALFHQQVFAPAPSITERNPKVSAPVEAALMTALKKEPDERFGSSVKFGRALHAPPALSPKKIWPITLLALTAGLLLGLVGIWFVTDGTNSVKDMFWPEQNTYSAPLASPPADALWSQAGGEPNQRATYYYEAHVLNNQPSWAYNPNSDKGFGIVGNDSRIVYADETQLVALDWASGEEAWKSIVGGEIIAAPVIHAAWDGPIVIAATNDGAITAFSLEDAQFLWRTSKTETGDLFTSHLTIDYDGVLYVTTTDGRFLAFDSATGALLREYEIEQSEDGTAFSTAASVANLGIFVTTDAGDLYAFNHDGTDPKWRINIADKPSSAPVIADNLGLILQVTENGRIKAFSLLGGDTQWEQNVNDYIAGIAVEWNQISTVTRNGKVNSFAADGVQLWETILGFEVSVPLLHLGDYVVVVTRDDGQVHYLHRSDGANDDSRTFALQQQVAFSPAPIGGWLYVRSAETIYGFPPE